MEMLSFFKPAYDGRNKITYLPTDKIKPNPYQPRKHFDKPALVELANSIAQYGVLQPIHVRKIGTGYELVAGERRLKASELAGLMEIPCIITEYNDNDSAIVALLENLQRQDLTFFEEAEGYQSLIERHGITQERLAEKIGKSQSTIANKIRLMRLPQLIKKMIMDNGLTERHARSLLKLPEESLQTSTIEEIVQKNLNVSETEKYVDSIIDKYLELPQVSVSTPKKGRKNIKIYTDIRIFVNTIIEAVHMMNESGINATSEKRETDDFIEYVVKIPKCV